MMILIAVIILNRGGVLILCLPDFCQDFENFLIAKWLVVIVVIPLPKNVCGRKMFDFVY
jgi:hypothetical protein